GRPRPALAALVLAAALASPPGGAPPEPGSAAAAHAAPLLWRVEKGGRTSHLFGTVHVGLDLDAAPHDAGRVALDDAKRVFVEFDLTSPAAIVALVYDALARGELPRGRSLRTLLRPETWDRLAARYKGRVPPATLDRMAPWFAVLTPPPAAAPVGKAAGRARRRAPRALARGRRGVRRGGNVPHVRGPGPGRAAAPARLPRGARARTRRRAVREPGRARAGAGRRRRCRRRRPRRARSCRAA